jgi:hypothetical protein
VVQVNYRGDERLNISTELKVGKFEECPCTRE